ncbi:MAG: hypothetical protein HYU74_05400 [Dechloromonas sp.]|nr:hypothetical protein [Dechloromonas sp.]
MTFLDTESARQKLGRSLVFVTIVLAGMALYVPFIGNELIFDDISFFYRGHWLSHFAVTPFDYIPRTLPYFSFAFIQTLTQSFEIQRLANLCLHCINGYLLFLLSQMLLSMLSAAGHAPRTNKESVTTLASGGIALAFVLHPVAVYGTGYLVQRTILFATFFSLFALVNLGRAFKSDSWPPLIWAASLSVLAMFSKEHAVTLPVAAIGLLWVVAPKPSPGQYRKAAAYLLICAPAMIWLVYALRWAIANPYEPHAPIYFPSAGEALWSRSALAQSGLYFEYLRLWLVPDTALMSIDLRAPFPETWSSPRALLGGIAFLLAFATGSYALLRSKHYRLLGLGLIYTQVLFMVELLSVRLQEPFVLYRSYLWAPGFMLMAASLLQQLSRRAILLIVMVTAPILAYQAVDRLNSISTGMKVWADAQAKLTRDELPGAFRIYYNRGVQYLRAKQYDLALTDFVTCNRLNPSYAGCHSGKAVVLSRNKNYESALDAIESALSIDPGNPSYWESKGNVLKALGQFQQANAAFAEAEGLGGSIGTVLRRGNLDNRTAPNTNQNRP